MNLASPCGRVRDKGIVWRFESGANRRPLSTDAITATCREPPSNDGCSHHNRTPISRPMSRATINPRKQIALNTVQQRQPPSFLQTLTAPAFSLCWLRTKSHQTPVGIKLAAMCRDRPGGLCHPRETLVPSRVQGVACIPYGYRHNDDASPLVAHGLGDSAICIHSDGAKAASKSFE